MRRNFWKNLIIAVGLAFLVGTSFVGAADDEPESSDDFQIDVEYPVGDNLNGGKIFNEDNILPGWETSKTIRVENDSQDYDANLYFRIDIDGGKKLSEKLKLYVIRVDGGSYRIGGEGDRYTLKEADGENLYLDKLSATKGKQYRIQIKFDEEAGNEYQEKSANFDIEFRIDQERAGTETEEEILANQGRTDFTGLPPVDEEPAVVAGEQEIEPEVQTEAASNGEVAGTNTQCNNWPWWVWLLILVGHLGAFYKLTFNKKGEDSEKIPWGWQATIAILAITFWWYFDSCREYPWFLYGSVGGSGLEYVIFLWVRNKRCFDQAEKVIEKGRKP